MNFPPAPFGLARPSNPPREVSGPSTPWRYVPGPALALTAVLAANLIARAAGGAQSPALLLAPEFLFWVDPLRLALATVACGAPLPAIRNGGGPRRLGTRMEVRGDGIAGQVGDGHASGLSGLGRYRPGPGRRPDPASVCGDGGRSSVAGAGPNVCGHQPAARPVGGGFDRASGHTGRFRARLTAAGREWSAPVAVRHARCEGRLLRPFLGPRRDRSGSAPWQRGPCRARPAACG